MNKSELIKTLRNATLAGMNDCKLALEESNWDLDKATDLVKARGLTNVAARNNKISTEGAVAIFLYFKDGWTSKVMLEVNCQTDFVARGQDFIEFFNKAGKCLVDSMSSQSETTNYVASNLEPARIELSAKTGENIVVRRWVNVHPRKSDHFIYSYEHSNNKIGVLLEMQTPMHFSSVDIKKEVDGFCNDVAMQIAAMNPLSLDRSSVSTLDVARQQGIFEKQLEEANKPKAAWAKILEGKFNKWYSEVCLLDQESIIVPKKTVSSLAEELSKKVNGTIKVVNFVRFEVGEGLQSVQTNLAEEVEKMTGISQVRGAC